VSIAALCLPSVTKPDSTPGSPRAHQVTYETFGPPGLLIIVALGVVLAEEFGSPSFVALGGLVDLLSSDYPAASFHHPAYGTAEERAKSAAILLVNNST
jgi:hypothetical protein